MFSNYLLTICINRICTSQISNGWEALAGFPLARWMWKNAKGLLKFWVIKSIASLPTNSNLPVWQILWNKCWPRTMPSLWIRWGFKIQRTTVELPKLNQRKRSIIKKRNNRALCNERHPSLYHLAIYLPICRPTYLSVWYIIYTLIFTSVIVL